MGGIGLEYKAKSPSHSQLSVRAPGVALDFAVPRNTSQAMLIRSVARAAAGARPRISAVLWVVIRLRYIPSLIAFEVFRSRIVLWTVVSNSHTDSGLIA